jgi:hypothetical protein
MTYEEQRRAHAVVGGMNNVLIYPDGKNGRPVRATVMSIQTSADEGEDWSLKACLVDCSGRHWEGVGGDFLDFAPASGG